MLDTVGITIDEVKGKFPPRLQTLNYDVALDYDSMYKPKILSSFELGINAILTLLFMKPGQYPSIPELGIDIESYLFEYSDDKRIPIDIKNKLIDQCSYIDIVGFDIDVGFDKTADGNDALVISITGNEYVSRGNETGRVIIGISYDKLNRLYVRKLYV
jgi:hypothetical protein